jgi:hypothetical protein
VAVVHDLEAALLVSEVLQQFGDVVNGHRSEGRRVTLVARERRDLGKKALDQVADGHAGGNGVRIDDDVWGNAFACERHVFLPVRDADGSLLAVPRGELVTDLRDADRADADLDELAAFGVGSEQYLV